jgi:hypothetical protein
MEHTFASPATCDRSVRLLVALSDVLTTRFRLETSAPITTVPVEVLGKIFLLAVGTRSYPSGSSSPSHEVICRRNLVLLQLTAVSSRWRTVAIDLGTLWSDIAFTTSRPSTIRYAELSLNRSKGSMLSVYIADDRICQESVANRYVEEVIKKVAAASGRISRCELFSSSPAFWGIWVLPAPDIRQLVFGGRILTSTSPLNAELLQLRSSALFSCGLWPLSNSRNLTSAELRSDNHHMSLTALLDAFRGCDALKSLVLHGFQTLEVNDTPPAIVVLPNLRRLGLFSCDSTLLLGHIEVPSLSEPLIIFNPTPYEDIMCSVPPKQQQEPYLRNLRKLQVTLNARRSQYSISAYREDGCLALYIGTAGVPHWLRWRWTRASVDAVARFGPFSTVHALSFSTDSLMTSWPLWFLNLRLLRQLSVACPGPDRLLSSLLIPDPGTGQPPCRALSSLALLRCDPYTWVSCVRLKELVLSRRATGVPLEKLILPEEEWLRMKHLDKAWVGLVEFQGMFRDDDSIPSTDVLQVKTGRKVVLNMRVPTVGDNGSSPVLLSRMRHKPASTNLLPRSLSKREIN